MPSPEPLASKSPPPGSGSLLQRMMATAPGQAALLALVALLVRALHLRYISGSPLYQAPVTDEWEHSDLAGTLAAGNWLGSGIGPYFRPQLFAYFLACLRVVTGNSLPAIHFILMVMDSATVGVMYLVARRAFPRRAALLGAGLLAVYWPLLHFSATFNKEAFTIHLQAWLLLALLLWLREIRRGRRCAHAVWAGVLAGLGLLCLPSLILPLMAALAAMLGVSLTRGRTLTARLSPVLAAVLALALLLPQAWRNYTVGGAPIFYSTNGWLNLYIANNDRGHSLQLNSPGIGWDILTSRPLNEAGIADSDYRAIDQFWKRQFLDYVRRRPLDFVRGVAAKMIEVTNAREVEVSNNFWEMARLSPVQRALPGTGLLLPLALLGMVRWLWERRGRGSTRRASGALLLLFGIVSLAATALVFPYTRHRLPTYAVLLLFAGPGITALVDPLRRGRLGRAVRPLLILAASAVLVNWPLPDGGLRRFEAWMDTANLGAAHAELWGRDHHVESLRAAIDAYEQALRIRPEGLLPLKQLPPLYLQAGRGVDALAVQRTLVERLRRENPESTWIRVRELRIAGQFAMGAGHPEDALGYAREWRGLRMLEPESMDLEAVALAAKGDRTAALAVAEERLRRTPDDPHARQLVAMLRRLPKAE